MELRNLKDLELKDKKVFLRLDLNVPINAGRITDDTRILASLDTIRFIVDQKAKVAIASHLGRPKGQVNQDLSLEPVGTKLAELLDREVLFVKDYNEQPISQVLNQISPKQIVLLENLRFHPEETKNDEIFSQSLASNFDIYVNDAFGTAHRAHASTEGVAQQLLPIHRACGFVVEKELMALDKIKNHPLHPFVVLIGGAKVSDKIGVVLNLINSCNHLLIGGAMAYTFLKFKGVNIGVSKIESDCMHLVESIYRNAEARNVKIHLPIDHVVATDFTSNSRPQVTSDPEISRSLMGLDIGPKTVSAYKDIIDEANTIFWNGPMGVFEWEAFAKGTEGIAKAVASSRAYRVVGGGDSVAAINKVGLSEKIDHISTGGGASLEYLEGKILPGLRVLQK